MKLNKFILLLSIFSVFFISCDNSDVIDGTDTTQSPSIIGWSKHAGTESYFSDLGTIQKAYFVKLINGAKNGGPLDKDVTFNVSVVSDETTANNDEFTLVTTNGVLAAGETFADVLVDVNTGNFNPTEPTYVTFKVETSVDGVVVSSLDQKFVLTFVGCASNLEGNYTDNSATGTNGRPVTISKFDDVYYHVSALPKISSEFWFEFKDICGTLTITTWELDGSQYVLTQVGDGYVDDTTGEIVFPSVSLATLDWYQNIELRYMPN